MANPVGRPTEYKIEYNRIVFSMALLGATDIEMAEALGVHEATLYRWKNEYPEFCEAINKGKIQADARVANSLYARALGYEHDDVDIRVCDGMIQKTPIRKIYPPDTTAAIFWLKNRRKDQWRDKQEIDHRSGDGSMSPADHSKAVLDALKRKHGE